MKSRSFTTSKLLICAECFVRLFPKYHTAVRPNMKCKCWRFIFFFFRSEWFPLRLICFNPGYFFNTFWGLFKRTKCTPSAFRRTQLSLELLRVLSCKSSVVFLHFPLEKKGPWGSFYQLQRVLAKETPTSNLTESTADHSPFMVLYPTLPASYTKCITASP